MTWIIKESDFPADAHPDLLSTIFTVGNGHTCTRGTGGEEGLGAFRGMYVAGLYTRAPGGLNYYLTGPDWLSARLTVGGKPARCTKSARTLDMKRGLLTRSATFKAGSTVVELTERRFCSLKFLTLLGQEIALTVKSGTGQVALELGCDGDVRNHRAKYYQPGEFPNCDGHGLKLAEIESVDAGPGGFHVRLLSRQNRIRIGLAGVVRQTDGPACQRTDGVFDAARAGATFTLPADVTGQTFTFEKLCRFVADVDQDARPAAGFDPDAFQRQLRKADFADALADSEQEWADFWSVADVLVEGDATARLAQRSVRFALWSTRIAACRNDGLASIGAKNLTGDWYRGAVFWDMEMYQVPLLSAVAPQLGANHVRYRARRLDAARTLAAQDGLAGARFPWHSYWTGLEEPIRLGGFRGQQLHLNVAVPWGILYHHALTGDDELLLEGGALAVLIEQAKFWASAFQVESDGRAHLRDVQGADEVHKHVDDNAYTNLGAAEVLRATAGLLDRLADEHADRVAGIRAACNLPEDAPAAWRDLADKIHLSTIDHAPGVLAQFDGFDRYAEPSEAVIAAQGEGTDKTNKQADTLMIWQAFGAGYERHDLGANFAWHASLCNQTSSLSMCTHALLAARLGRLKTAMKLFVDAAGVDLADSYGNTRHGIHGAGQGGIWMAVVMGFGGLEVDVLGSEPAVRITPMLPPGWTRLSYRLIVAGQAVCVDVAPSLFTVSNQGDEPVRLIVAGKEITLGAGDSEGVPHRTDWPADRLGGVVIDMAALFAAGTARKLLDDLADVDTSAAVVTETGSDAVLGGMGLAGKFAARVDGRDITADPPADQLYYLAAQRLRVLPWECVAVCASAEHVESAHRAGMVALGIGPAAAGAEMTVPSFSAVTPELLAELFASHETPSNPYLARNVAKMQHEQAGG